MAMDMNVYEWDGEGDRFTLDDSDMDEDSMCSWISEPESLCNNWRGWRKQAPSLLMVQRSISSDGQVAPLTELSAQAVACHLPFELVEHYHQPIPEQLQLRIAFWSFPKNEEDIRLYSCLINGSADEFNKGEQLFKSGAVQDALQIGFHLSANVASSQMISPPNGIYNVGVSFDRRRITNCSCSCKNSACWCAHIVALCLCRIHQPSLVRLRSPVSESLGRLQRDQLQKFAQYLICELPRHFLPTAQALLDDLLSAQPTAINEHRGAPDPTAGPSASELSAWNLNELALHDNIKKTMIKFCVPSPMVFSDVNYLSSTAPPAAAEWANLLRPLRGREPEGMWNLLSIVREMYRRHDSNAIPLLDILTEEVMACEQILVWWFNTKLITFHGNSQQVHRQGQTNSSQYAATSLCDEIVILWRLAALDPSLSPILRDDLQVRLRDWHIRIIDRIRKTRAAPSNLKKQDIEAFSGFKPALEACQLDWSTYMIPEVTYQDSQALRWRMLKQRAAGKQKRASSRNIGIVQNTMLDTATFSLQRPIPGAVAVAVAVAVAGAGAGIAPAMELGALTDASSSSEGFCERGQEAESDYSDVGDMDGPVAQDPREGVAENALPNDELQVYYYDVDPRVVQPEVKQSNQDEPNYFLGIKKSDNAQDILFARAEALHTHGHTKEACKLAQELAQQMLSTPIVELEELNKAIKKKKSSNISSFSNSTLAKAAFLCSVLCEYPSCHELAFKLGMFGLEMPRLPAGNKALEVKLAHQESELAALLKRIPLTGNELDIVKDRAERLQKGQLKTRGDALLPLTLASFIFDSLCLPNAKKKVCPRLEKLGFEAAVTALGLKANVSEAEHPLLCEGTRRQRGELTIAMLVHYKDDQRKLSRILDKLLDKEVHQLYRGPSLSSCMAGGIQQTAASAATSSSAEGIGWNLGSHHLDYLDLEERLMKQMSLSERETGAKPKTSRYHSQRDTDSSNVEEDSAEWKTKSRCVMLKSNKKPSVGMAAIDSSAPETTSSDNSPTLVRRQWSKHEGTGSDSGSDSVGSNSFTGSKSRELDSPPGTVSSQRMLPHLLAESRSPTPNVKASRFKGKSRSMPTVPNQPSEASAHFMFELAKTVLTKAGGNSSTSLFTQPSNGTSHVGPHRALHLCAFQIGLYALGLHNYVSANWLSRTYSSHVSWITGQAMEIGSAAITILINTWDGHLTPQEVASLADRASRARDPAMVKTAAELALSCLPHAQALNPNEIMRALIQCREQSQDMLERACLAVEDAAKGGGVYPEVLFSVARKWYELYEESGLSPEVIREEIPVTQALVPLASPQELVLLGSSQQPILQIVCPQLAVSSGQQGQVSGVTLSAPPIPYTLPPPANPQLPHHPYIAPYSYVQQANYGHHYSQPHIPLHTHNIHPSYMASYPYNASQNQPAFTNIAHLNPTTLYHANMSHLIPPPAPIQLAFQQATPQNTQQSVQALVPVLAQGNSVPHMQMANPAQPTQTVNQTAAVQIGNSVIQSMPPGNSQVPVLLNNMVTSSFCSSSSSSNSSLSSSSMSMHSSVSVPSSSSQAGGSQQAASIVQAQTNEIATSAVMILPLPDQSSTLNQAPSSVQMNYLLASYRVGMLAMETLAKRVHDDRPQTKYARNPPYGEDVKWLLGITIKLGNTYLQQFCASAVNAIVSPFVLQDIAVRAARYMARNNLTQVSAHLRSPTLNSLIQKCLQMFIQCTHQRMHHITQAEYDEFVGIVCSARNAFLMTPSGMVQFNELLQSLRRTKSCKKELWSRIVNGLSQSGTAL